MTNEGRGVLPHQLKTWWETGEGAAKIRWGTEGSFDRCVRLAVEHAHMTPEQAKGFCAERHKAATGHWPGEKKSWENVMGDCGCDDHTFSFDEGRASGDNSPWDGGAAMSACSKSENPAKCYSSICAGRKAGDPSKQSSWALPHHKTAGGPPNAAGVRAALGRLSQTQGLQNAGAARKHLEAHQSAINGKRDLGMEIERRYTPTVVELRMSADRHRIGGYAATFDRLSRNLGGFVEVVERSFFNKSRADGWPGVIARYNHDDNMLLGTTGARTLDLTLDETGLLYEVDPPQSRTDILELVERGDVRHSSFAFRVFGGGDEWTMTDQGYPLRRLHEGQLVDVSPVVSPAYLDTSVGLRSLASFLEVELDVVKQAVEVDELRKFFKRSDGGPVKKQEPPKPRLWGAAAKSALLGKREGA